MSEEPDEAVVHLVRALGNRAERALFVASPRDLPDVRDDNRVHLSGISLPESNMSVPGVAEGYVWSGDLDDVARPLLAIAGYLVEHDGVREKSEAIRAIAELRARWVARGAHGVGAKHG